MSLFDWLEIETEGKMTAAKTQAQIVAIVSKEIDALEPAMRLQAAADLAVILLAVIECVIDKYGLSARREQGH